MCYTPWNCPICYGEGFGPRCEHKPGCHYVPEPSFLERWEAAKTPWAQVRVMEGEWNTEAMFPEIGRAAVTLQEVTRWARRYCTGTISFQDFAAALPAYLDPQETLMQYIDDEEARFERMRTEGHKLARAAAPPVIDEMIKSGKIKIKIKGTDGKEQVIGSVKSFSAGTFQNGYGPVYELVAPSETPDPDPDHKLFSAKFNAKAKEIRAQNPCKCDIKNLMSTGHDSGCSEKKP